MSQRAHYLQTQSLREVLFFLLFFLVGLLFLLFFVFGVRLWLELTVAKILIPSTWWWFIKISTSNFFYGCLSVFLFLFAEVYAAALGGGAFCPQNGYLLIHLLSHGGYFSIYNSLAGWAHVVHYSSRRGASEGGGGVSFMADDPAPPDP